MEREGQKRVLEIKIDFILCSKGRQQLRKENLMPENLPHGNAIVRAIFFTISKRNFLFDKGKNLLFTVENLNSSSLM